MTTIFTSYKKIVLLFLILITALFLVKTVFAQTATQSATELTKKYNVSFPISALGGCTDITSCRNFCEDPLNAQRCIDYAKSKGFYKEPEIKAKKDDLVKAAKASLGCDSETSCMNFCSVPTNHDRCDSFAKVQGISGGVVSNPSSEPIIEKAKEVLGCNSESSCKSLCEQEDNRQKCADFAKQVGLNGGERKIGPGGCSSESNCKAFCVDPNNFQICSGFSATAGSSFKGPGGCNSETSCRTYCQTHESECSAGFNQGGGQANYNTAERCNKTPNCSWTGSTCQCGFYGETKETAGKAQEYAAYCRVNPEKCKFDQDSVVDPLAKRLEFEDYCSKNPEKCKVTTTAAGGSVGARDYFDPASQCGRYGCSWNGNSCQCAGIKEYNNRDSQDAACKSGGGICQWNGDFCNCQGYKYSYPTPYTNTYSYPTPYSGGESGSCKEPSSGCPGGWYWNASACSCNPNAGTKLPDNCSQPAGGCPSGWTWVASACSCNYTGSDKYSYPTPYTNTYSYPTPYSGTYSYPTPYTNTYSYPTPYSGTYSYPTPYSYSYPTPQAYSYPTPQTYSYPTPQAYSYPTPQSYSYPTPQSYSYPTPSGVQGISTSRSPSLLELILDWFN